MTGFDGLRKARSSVGLVISSLVWLCLLVCSNVVQAETRNVTTYYHNNIQGTPIAASDEDGNPKWTQTYSSFGFHGGNDGQADDRNSLVFGTAGHVEDQYDGRLLVYMQARHYDPELGRFLSIDPVGFSASNPQSFNRYAYANSNPIVFVDPDGRLAETVWDAFNVAIGAASFAYNVSEGNYGSAAIDAAGLAYDIVATGVPILPGGAATLNQGRRAADAVGRGYSYAVGLWRHPGSSESGLLKRFAERTGALTYADVVGHSFPVESAMLDALSNADAIKFNLEGFDLAKYKEFATNPSFKEQNYTNWELHNILTDQTLLNKTTFYDGAGNVVDTPKMSN